MHRKILVAAALTATLVLSNVRGAESKPEGIKAAIKQGAREMGADIKQGATTAGKAIAKGAKEVGKTTAQEARKVKAAVFSDKPPVNKPKTDSANGKTDSFSGKPADNKAKADSFSGAPTDSK
ncbi:MAG: hypothetical protein ABI859_04745 [Pseudomonadota bacterium]